MSNFKSSSKLKIQTFFCHLNFGFGLKFGFWILKLKHESPLRESWIHLKTFHSVFIGKIN